MSKKRIRLNHIAVAVPEVEQVLGRLRHLGLQAEATHPVPTEKVEVTFLPLAVAQEVHLELLKPTASDSPVSKFLEKRPSGGLHHLSFEVDDLDGWKRTLESAGLEILPPGIRKSAKGQALFIHPKSMAGVLVELEEQQ